MDFKDRGENGMKFNMTTDYALRVVLHLSLFPFGTKITGAELAQAQMIPESFLLKIMRHLTGSHIIQSHRGPAGGFSLGRPAEQITLFDVVEAIEGDLFFANIDDCVVKQTDNVCAVRHVFYDIQKSFSKELSAVNFAVLAKREVLFRRGHRK